MTRAPSSHGPSAARRARRRLLLPIVLVPIGLILGILALSQTAAVRHRAVMWVESRLQEMLGREVRVDGMTLQPWGGRLELRRVRVARGRTLAEGVLFSTEAIRARWSWSALLRRQVVLRQLTLVRPHLTLPEGAAPGLAVPEALSRLLQPQGMKAGGWLLSVRQASVQDGEVAWSETDGTRGRVEGVEGELAWLEGWKGGGAATARVQAARLTTTRGDASRRLERISLQATGTVDTVSVIAAELHLAGARVTARGHIADPARAPRLDLEVGVQAPLDAVLSLLGSDRRIDGGLAMDGRLRGPWEQAVFRGEGAVHLGKDGKDGGPLRFSLRWDEGRLEAETPSSPTGAGGSFHGRLSITPATGAYEVRARLTDTNLATLAGVPVGIGWTQADLRIPPGVRGRVTADVDLTGRGMDLAALRGRAAVSVDGLALEGETPTGRLEARIAATVSRLDVETFILRVAGGEIRGRGGLSFGDGSGAGTLDLPVRADLRDVGAFARGFGVPFVHGRADLRGRIVGTAETPRLQGRLTWREARIAGHAFDLIEGEIDLGPRVLRTPRLVARAGKTAATLRGGLQALGTAPLRRLNPRRDLVLDLEGQVSPARTADLASLLPDDLEIHGVFRASGRVTGTLETLTGDVEVSLENVRTWEESWRRGGALVRFRNGAVEITQVVLRRGAEELTGEISLGAGGALQGRLASTVMDLTRVGSLSGSRLSGRASFRLELQGTVRDTITQGQATVMALSYREIPVGPGTATFRIERKAVDVDLTVREGTHRLRLSVGPPPDRSVTGALTLTDADLDLIGQVGEIVALRPFEMRVSGSIQFRGPAPAAAFEAGEAEFSALRLLHGGESWENRGSIHVGWIGPAVTVRQMRLGAGEHEFDVRGTVSEGGQSDLQVTGQLPWVALARFFPVARPAEGVADVSLRFRGRRSALEPQGTLAIQRGRFSLPGLPAEFREARVALDLEGSNIRIREWEARLAEGNFRGSGEIRQQAGRWDLRLMFQEDAGRAEQLLPLYGGKGEVTGALAVGGFVTSRGEDAADFWRNLDGDLTLVMRDGRIGHNTVMARILALLNMAQLLELRGPDLPGEGMPYRSLTGDITIARGVARTENLVLDGPAVKATAVGQINLAEDTVDLTVAARPFQNVDRIIAQIPLAGWLLTGKEQSLVVAYYEVTGPIRDPKVTPIPMKSVGRNVFGIFRNLLEIPETLTGPYEDLPPQQVKPDEGQKR